MTWTEWVLFVLVIGTTRTQIDVAMGGGEEE